MTTYFIDNTNHFEKMKELVEEGTELRKIIDSYNQFPMTPEKLLVKSHSFKRYQEIAQELHTLPEELARKWNGARGKLITNKIYPYGKE